MESNQTDRVWTRKKWAVELTSSRPVEKPMIIGARWDDRYLPRYHGEPTRALLFDTRKQAREWCASKRFEATLYGWKFTPVRVIESITRC